jgi:YvrJ protein family
MLLEAAASANGLDGLVGLLREFGFPTFVCIWLMWRLEKRLDKFTESIDKLLQIVIVMAKTMDADSAGKEKAVKGERAG